MFTGSRRLLPRTSNIITRKKLSNTETMARPLQLYQPYSQEKPYSTQKNQVPLFTTNQAFSGPNQFRIKTL